MRIVDELNELRDWRRSLGAAGTVDLGFVPTMGALHEGHAALVRRAREECRTVAVSIFVNPTQFGPGEDFEIYPRTRDADLELLAGLGVDLVWFGDASQMYPPGFATEVRVPRLARGLCGRGRPGHFDGVALVVTKLFGLFRPDRAYFGRKDYQQFVIVRRMAADLELGVEVVPCPIVREPDGLALSSRNARLTDAERAVAPRIHEALLDAERKFGAGQRNAAALTVGVAERIAAESRFDLEYVELVHPSTLEPLVEFPGDESEGGGAVLAVAARLGSVRLIDNIALGVSE